MRTSTLLLTCTIASASPLGNPQKSQSIQWRPCNETALQSEIPLDCGTLRVPKDYTSSNGSDTVELHLARVPAATQPAKGSIQFNFGGPGLTCRDALASLSSELRVLTGGEYDLVTFDPRGTGQTLPFQCTDSEIEAMQMLIQTPMGNASDVTVGALWARGEVSGEMCQAKLKETGELVGTAFTARDLMQVAEALEEDGLLRYWGLSYGTTLGATVAAMFPDRIEKMILDGVQNPHEYYHALANFQEWTGSDEAFSAIFEGCVAAPENCTLARGNATAAELEQKTWDLLDQVKREPMVIGGMVVDYSLLKGFLQESLYGMNKWPGVATVLDLVFSNKTEELAAAFGEQVAGMAPPSPLAASLPLTALYGIQCGDRTARASMLDDFLPAVEELYNISRIYGDATVSSMAACAQWPYTAKEVYQGDFCVKTKNPVLFLGNTGDAHTPLVSAYNLSSTFEGSAVLEIDGYGHASTSLPSSCSWKHVAAYWQNLTMPASGTQCVAEAQPFNNVTWADVFAMEAAAAKVSKRDTYTTSQPRLTSFIHT